MQVTLNTAKRILERLLPVHATPPVYLEGAPGVGKSAIVHAVAATLDLPVLDVRAAYLTPPDLIGLPALERDSGRTTYYLPEFLPEPLTKGILVLEELPSAAPAIQVALYQLLLDRRVGWRYELPPGWRVVATGNRLEDGYTHPLSNAMATRLLRLEIRADLEEFTAYAVQHARSPDGHRFRHPQPEPFCINPSRPHRTTRTHAPGRWRAPCCGLSVTTWTAPTSSLPFPASSVTVPHEPSPPT
ncbi:MAG: AAA domain-containing protein [Pleurocapsa sp. SU_196_0]|nr:AAA domain-containing protein [Pleurocapsa sp. SU_196_0]